MPACFVESSAFHDETMNSSRVSARVTSDYGAGLQDIAVCTVIVSLC